MLVNFLHLKPIGLQSMGSSPLHGTDVLRLDAMNINALRLHSARLRGIYTDGDGGLLRRRVRAIVQEEFERDHGVVGFASYNEVPPLG